MGSIQFFKNVDQIIICDLFRLLVTISNDPKFMCDDTIQNLSNKFITSLISYARQVYDHNTIIPNIISTDYLFPCESFTLFDSLLKMRAFGSTQEYDFIRRFALFILT